MVLDKRVEWPFKIALFSIGITLLGYTFAGSPLSSLLGSMGARWVTFSVALLVFCSIKFDRCRRVSATAILAYGMARGLGIVYDGGAHPAVLIHWASTGLAGALLMGVLHAGTDGNDG